jgi:hypothetical protein
MEKTTLDSDIRAQGMCCKANRIKLGLKLLQIPRADMQPNAAIYLS